MNVIKNTVDDDNNTCPNRIAGKYEDGIRHVPPHMGTGFIKGYIFNPKLRMIVRQYQLKEDWVVDRGFSEYEDKMVRIAFHHNYYATDDFKYKLLQLSNSRQILPSVQVATTALNYELLPANKIVNSIVITVHADYLKELLKPTAGNDLLQTILTAEQPLLFEEIISPLIQDVAAEIIKAKPMMELADFFYRIKTEELIYLLFAELLKRENTTLQALNAIDVQRVYEVRNKLLADLNKPSAFAELVKLSGMSESKLKRLFKQIFGKSIYSYYQGFRMKEAAYLIREERFSVSEVGYRLGFTNLSHFSRLFEAHIGKKPKKYAAGP